MSNNKIIIKEYTINDLVAAIHSASLSQFLFLLGIEDKEAFDRILKPKMTYYDERQWIPTIAEIIVNLFIAENKMYKLNNKTVIYTQKGLDNLALTSEKIDSARRLIRFESKSKISNNTLIINAFRDAKADISKPITTPQKESDLMNANSLFKNKIIRFENLKKLKLNNFEKKLASDEIKNIKKGQQKSIGAGLVAYDGKLGESDIPEDFVATRITFLAYGSYSILDIWKTIKEKAVLEGITNV